MLALMALALSVTGASGTVTYVTAGDAYLDVGRSNGVTAGAQLKASRRKKAIGTCDVVEVSATNARCRSDKLRPGDRVWFEVVPEPAKPPAPPRDPLPDDVDLAEQREVVLAAPLPKVAHKKTAVAGVGIGGRATATLREEVWAVSTTPNSVFGRTTIEGGARADIDVSPWVTGTNVTFSGALRVVGDLIAPPEQQVVNIYLWNASLGANGGGIVGELGRFRPRLAPGATLVDGLQLGARFLGDTTEVGAYGGAVPDLLTTAATTSQLTAGAYVSSDIVIAPGVMALPRARAAVLSNEDLSVVRGELEAQAQIVWQGVGVVGASARAGAGGTDAPPSLDAVRVDADVAVMSSLRAYAGYRYLGVPPVDFDLGAALVPIGGAHHASAGAGYTLTPDLTLGAITGVGYDVVTDATRAYVGPEVALPHAFGTWGGMDVGYLEEIGSLVYDLGGRSAWVTGHLTPTTPLPGLRVVARVSYLEFNALGDALREVGLLTLADAPLAPLVPWLSVRARAYLQQALPTLDGAARTAPSVLAADLALTGSL